MDWLPLERLSKQIHMVISTLPDELSPPDGRPFRCLLQLERRLVGAQARGQRRLVGSARGRLVGRGRREAAGERTQLLIQF